MMRNTLFLLFLSFSATLAAPAAQYEEYKVIIPQKRAALVLDRLLVALQKALQDGAGAPDARYVRFDRDGPRAAPLRITPIDDVNGMLGGAPQEGPLLQRLLDEAPPFRNIQDDYLNALQRRGGEGRGRVVKCYFNAITCF